MAQQFSIEETELSGVKLIKPFVSEDERGFFIKDYSRESMKSFGIEYNLEEVFYTESKRGVIRGIHFQRVKEQAKLVRCIAGEVYDVIVDLRAGSGTFGKWRGFYLTGENRRELLIPEHFGHAYLVIKDSIVSYKCAEKFYGEYDDGIVWNDRELGISWPLDRVEKIIISDKDKKLQSFRTFQKNLK